MDESSLQAAGAAGSAPGLSIGSESAREREERAALASCAGLYLVGATLTATSALLPHVDSPAGVVAVAVSAYSTAAALMLARVRASNRLTIAWLADLWGVVLIGVLCASTGGASSPFGLIYFFAIGHAAAFQPRRRVLDVCLAALAGFLAPLAYGHVSRTYWAIAFVGVALALLCAAVVHYALERMREERSRLEFLINATANIGSSLDPRQTLTKVARTAVPELADLCVIDLIDSDGSITATVAAASDPRLAAAMEECVARTRSGSAAGTLWRTLCAAGRRSCATTSRARRSSPRPPRTETSRLAFCATRDAAPQRWCRWSRAGACSGRCRSCACRAPPATRPPRSRCSRISPGAPRSRSTTLACMPSVPTSRTRFAAASCPRSSLWVPGLQLASFFRPTGAGSEVGGDFYDVFTDGDDCWLVVGDVCGKGADAAVLTGFLRHTTLAYAREEVTPAEVLARVNDAMLDQDFDGRFATAILARLRFSLEGVQLTLAAAGHPPALISRAAGGAEEFGENGTLLGVFDDPIIVDSSTILAPGDTLALYTDGLTEAHAPQPAHRRGDARGVSRREPAVAQEVVDAWSACSRR